MNHKKWGEKLPPVWIDINNAVRITAEEFKYACTYARPVEQPSITTETVLAARKELDKIAEEIKQKDWEMGEKLGCYVKTDLSGTNIYPHLNRFGLPKYNQPI